MDVWWALKTVLSSCISQIEHSTAEVEDGTLEQSEATGSAFMASSSYQNVFAKVRQGILDAPHRSLNESTLGSALATQQVTYLLMAPLLTGDPLIHPQSVLCLMKIHTVRTSFQYLDTMLFLPPLRLSSDLWLHLTFINLKRC